MYVTEISSAVPTIMPSNIPTVIPSSNSPSSVQPITEKPLSTSQLFVDIDLSKINSMNAWGYQVHVFLYNIKYDRFLYYFSKYTIVNVIYLIIIKK